MAEEIDEVFETKTEVENIIAELKAANINFDNYKNYVAKIINTSRIISAQIESLIREYRALKKVLDEKKESKQYKRAVEEEFVPIVILNLYTDINTILRDAYSWKTLEVQMHNLIFNKISQVLDDAKALDIKRDALKEMREMETKRNDLFLQIMSDTNKMIEEVINNKLSVIDEKIISATKLVLQEAMTDKKETVAAFVNIMKEAGIENKKLLDGMKNSNKELPDNIKKPIGNLDYERTKPKTESKETKEVIDEDPFADEDEVESEDKFLAVKEDDDDNDEKMPVL